MRRSAETSAKVLPFLFVPGAEAGYVRAAPWDNMLH